MLFPISMDIFPKPIKIPKFVALVFEVQSAIKMENIKLNYVAHVDNLQSMKFHNLTQNGPYFDAHLCPL